MSTPRMPPAVVGPIHVYRELVKARAALANAHKATEDRIIADELERMRRKLPDMIARAERVLEYHGGTKQLALGDGLGG